jgi:hypothetical protein
MLYETQDNRERDYGGKRGYLCLAKGTFKVNHESVAGRILFPYLFSRILEPCR